LNKSVQAFAINGSNIFAGTNNGVFLSTNKGVSWTNASAGLPTHSSIQTLSAHDSIIFAGTHDGVYLSINNGESWTAVNSGLKDSINVCCLKIRNDGNVFAGTRSGLYRSADKGTSWIAVNSGLTSTYVSCLAASDSVVFAGTFSGGVFLSTNNGTSWTAANSGLPNNTWVFSLDVSGSNVFAATDEGVYLSMNRGTSWASFNIGLADKHVRSLAVGDKNIFAVSHSGVFLYTNSATNWALALAQDSTINTIKSNKKHEDSLPNLHWYFLKGNRPFGQVLIGGIFSSGQLRPIWGDGMCLGLFLGWKPFKYFGIESGYIMGWPDLGERAKQTWTGYDEFVVNGPGQTVSNYGIIDALMIGGNIFFPVYRIFSTISLSGGYCYAYCYDEPEQIIFGLEQDCQERNGNGWYAKLTWHLAIFGISYMIMDISTSGPAYSQQLDATKQTYRIGPTTGQSGWVLGEPYSFRASDIRHLIMLSLGIF
jgi:hypothetical protein